MEITAGKEDGASPTVSWKELDDACISAIFSKLDARSLACVTQLDRRSRAVASVDNLWRSPYAADFPYHFGQRRQSQGAPWKQWYEQRLASETNWQKGRLSGQADVLRAHSGPVFSTRFLGPPFPPDLALSGGVFGQNEASELVLWDLAERSQRVGRLGWRLAEDGMTNLCGVFDLRQVPGTRQVLCCGFGPEVNVGMLEPRQPCGCGDSEYGCSHLRVQLETNLGLPGGNARWPAARQGWELRHTHTLVGHDAACPSVACQSGGLAVTASFDGTLRLWQIPAELGAGAAMENSEPVVLSAAAVLRDPFSVKTWDLESGKVALRLAGHEGWVWHVESLDDTHAVLLSGGTDSSIRMWDTRAGRQVQRVNICTETLYPIAGMCLRPPDQRYVICGVFDGSVRVVDMRQMRTLCHLEGHSDRVTRVSCNGDSILSGSFDTQVNLWTF
ncbi:hypothetical protein N2152v2_004456 [Parachlorella kessleri]